MVGIEGKRKNFVQRKNEEDRLTEVSNFVSSEIDDKSAFVIEFFRNCDKEGIDNLYNFFILDKAWISWEKQLEKKVHTFLDILFSDEYTYRFKKILLELNYPYELVDRFNRAMVNLLYNRYDLSSFDDEGKLIESIIVNSDSVYKGLKAEEINNKIREIYSRDEEHFKFSNGINYFPVFMNEDAYGLVDDLYDSYYEDKDSIIFNMDNFFVFSEFLTYKIENSNLSQFGIKDNVRWVSRYDGDSFHYDILSYDPERDLEKIIEVKSTINERDSYVLSLSEFAFFNQSNDADRYVYWFKLIGKSIRLFILKYVPDSKYGYFVDQDGIKYDISKIQYESVAFEVYPTEEKVCEKGRILSRSLCKMLKI